MNARDQSKALGASRWLSSLLVMPGGSTTIRGTSSKVAKRAAAAPSKGLGVGTMVSTSVMPRASISALKARAAASSPRPISRRSGSGGRNVLVAVGHGETSHVPSILDR